MDSSPVGPASDDWRLQVDIHDSRHAASLLERFDARELEHDLSDAFHDRLVVSRDDDRVFVYAGTRAQAEKARDLIASLADRHGWAVDAELTRWHPEALDWQDPDAPLPEPDAVEQAEHRARVAAERQALAETGEPEFEVRVDLPTHREAARFAEKLRAEGLPAVRRWRYLVVGAGDEDEAKALAARIEGEAPGGSEVTAEGSGKVAWAERPPNPFAVLGGLGG